MNCIVTTTINPPTEAIQKFDQLPNWKLIVAGDKKTPAYKLARGVYLSPEEQESYDKALSDAIGWNCVERRNLGLLLAWDMQAEVIALVDDDNIPLARWGENLHVGCLTLASCYAVGTPVFDPLRVLFPSLWHRGYPLQLLQEGQSFTLSRDTVTPSIQEDFWEGDPDLDAICRIANPGKCSFRPEDFPIASNRVSPVNSQNTFLLREVLPDYFLFPGVGRVADIWAGYYAQAWNHRVIYGAPSVVQKRNPHDLVQDLQEELFGYRHTLKIAVEPFQIGEYLTPQAEMAWRLYQRHF